MSKISQKTMLELFGFKSRNTLNEWKKSDNRKIFELVNKYFDEEDITEFLNEGKISKLEYDNVTELFFTTYKEVKKDGNESSLIPILENFNIMQTIEKKFRDMYNEKNFFNYILNGYSNKISNVILLAKILKESKIKPTFDTAKECLLNLVESYELKLMEDRVTHLLTNKKKGILKLWIEEELDDIACYIILSNIPDVMEILSKNINHLNKDILAKMAKEASEEKKS